MILFAQYSLTAAAVTLSDATILGAVLPAGITKVYSLNIRNATGAANPIYGGKSNVTNAPANAGFQIAAATDLPFGPFEKYLLDFRDIFIVGTVNAANIAYITVVI